MGPLYCKVPVNAVSLQGSGVIVGIFGVSVTNMPSSFSYFKNGIVADSANLPIPRVRLVTTIAIAFVVTSLTLGIGKFALSATIPFLKYEKLEGILVTDTPKIPTITPDPWRETAFTGTLQYSGPIQKYYLITTSSEAIALEVPVNIDLKDTVGKRIFAAGNYNKITRTLVVASASDLEVLPKKPSPFPTVIPTPTLFETTTPNTSPTYIP